MTLCFANPRGRYGHADATPAHNPAGLTPSQVYTSEVEQFLSALGLPPIHFRKLQQEYPTKHKIKRFYAEGITDNQRVIEVLKGVECTIFNGRQPWDVAAQIDWDRVELLLDEDKSSEMGILQRLFKQITRMTLAELEQTSTEFEVMGPGKLPFDRERKRLESRSYTLCPHERRWIRDELFGYRFEVITLDHVMIYTYGNPPEQDIKQQTQSYHATLKESIESAFLHLDDDEPDREVLIRYKSFDILRGVRINGEYEWKRDCHPQWGVGPCPITQDALQKVLFDVETQMLGEVKSAENFLLDDLGL